MLLKDILLAFIPLFVAVDAIGVLPIFVSLTEGLGKAEKSKIIIQSMLTASLLAIGFIFVGQLVFKLLGITIGDFMVAGGALLFCIAIRDLVSSTKESRIPDKESRQSQHQDAADEGHFAAFGKGHAQQRQQPQKKHEQPAAFGTGPVEASERAQAD